MAAPKQQKSPTSSVSENDEKSAQDEGSDLIPGFPDVASFSQHMLSCVMKAVQAGNGLPNPGEDFHYFNSFESVRELMDSHQKRILQVMQELVWHEGIKGNFTPGNTDIDVDDRYDVLVDANDQILERVGTWLDEAAGLRKQEAPLVIASTKLPDSSIKTSWNKKQQPHDRKKSSNFRLLAARYVQRPQLKFKDKVDNTFRPFCPILKTKPNALKSLEESLQAYYDQNDASQDNISYPHPYQYELDHFTPRESQLESDDPKKPCSIEESPYQYVDTLQLLDALCDDLKSVKIFACDLEHHSYRSYLGITCLMQISTQYKDYIVDTLSLRSDLHRMNEVFTDPDIVKVFHGADSDILWLQRDLGIYVVNMFDTGQSARVLNYARFSLAHLLEKYCEVTPDKTYQLADWRIRPLPEELVKYAREDTHYLLYIYACMKQELLDRGNEQKNLLKVVLARSTQVCAQKYVKPIHTDSTHLELYHKSRKVFNHQQLAAFKSLFAWRDATGRQDDESTGYILPNHMLLHVAEILPRETQGILACCNPIPPLVRQYLGEIHRHITVARKVHNNKGTQEVTASASNSGINRATNSEPASASSSGASLLKPTRHDAPVYNAGNILSCPHDMSHSGTGDSSLTTSSRDLDPTLVAKTSNLLPKNRASSTASSLPSNTSISSVFSWRPNHKLTAALQKVQRIIKSMKNPMETYIPPVDATTWQARLTSPEKVNMTSSLITDGSSMEEESPYKQAETQQQARQRWGSSLTRKRTASPDLSKPGSSQQHTPEEELVSVRHQFKKPRSDSKSVLIMEKAPTSSLGAELVDSSGKVNKSAIEEEVAARLKEFKAFDYTQSDYGQFQKDQSKRKRKKKDRDFKADDDSNFKTYAKFKAVGKTGKSLSYTGKESGNGAGVSWPKNKR